MMQKFKNLKNKQKAVWIGIAAALISAAALAVIISLWMRKKNGEGSENVAYTQTVAEWMGASTASGMTNRFSGIVESPDTWSAQLEPEAVVAKVLVNEGDEVKKDQELFVYSTEKYETDLAQADIDLTRMNNEIKSIQDAMNMLKKQLGSASGTERANLSLQIEEQNLSLEQKKLDIEGKENEIAKLKEKTENAAVKSPIDGVVKSVRNPNAQQDESMMDNQESNAFLTIMQTGDLRVKGTVNEQNIGILTEGSPVIVHSRVDEKATWTGSITKIDKDKTASDQTNAMYGFGESSNSSTNYNFYVRLDSSEGLMMGQHVYLEQKEEGLDSEEAASSASEKEEGILLYSFLVDQSDPEHPFVWKANKKNRLKKQEVTLAGADETAETVLVTDGLAMEDEICMPDESLKEGMKTKPMSEMTQDMAGDAMQGGDMGGRLKSPDGLEGNPEDAGMMEEGEPIENAGEGENGEHKDPANAAEGAVHAGAAGEDGEAAEESGENAS